MAIGVDKLKRPAGRLNLELMHTVNCLQETHQLTRSNCFK